MSAIELSTVVRAVGSLGAPPSRNEPAITASNSRMPKPFFSLSAGSLWERRTPKGADSKVAAARIPTAGR